MDKRTEEERDILKEIGNIGGGNALTSLSAMLGRPLEMDVPACHVVKYGETGKLLKNPDSLYAGISMTMSGTVECVLVLLMNRRFAEVVIEALDPDEPDFDVESLTEMQKSALCEVGNIMGNSYVTAIGALLSTRIDVSVPQIAVDAGSHVLQGFLDGHTAPYEQLLLVDSSFRTEDDTLESCMLMCPTDESLSAMLSQLSF